MGPRVVITSGIPALSSLLRETMEQDAVGVVGKTYIEELPKLYDQGVGGDGVTMDPYNAGYAKRLGIERSPKTLTRGEGRLHAMQLIGDMVTVSSDEKIQKMALGQQTGHSGSWPYCNIMFGHNETIEYLAGHNLSTFIGGRISTL